MNNIEIVPGDASKDRFFAAVFDNVFAIVVALIAAAVLPRDEVVLRGAAMVAAYFGYFFLFEAALGSSPGKLAFGLWVRRLEGGPCSWRQAGLRTLARLLEVNPLLLGALPAGLVILSTAHRQRLGDLLAGTAVRKGRGV